MDIFKDLSNGQLVVLIIIVVFLVLPLLIALCGWITSILWNYIMPVVFGLTTISVKQGVALYLLARLLFGVKSISKDDD